MPKRFAAILKKMKFHGFLNLLSISFNRVYNVFALVLQGRVEKRHYSLEK